MKKMKGIVKEVYIPIEKNQDIMFSKKIFFKVEINNEIIFIEEEADIDNSKIFKGDRVIITKQIISNKEFIDIKKNEDDFDE